MAREGQPLTFDVRGKKQFQEALQKCAIGDRIVMHFGKGSRKRTVNLRVTEASLELEKESEPR